jgi:hypothetical protein
MASVYDCSIIHLPKIHNRSGNITIVENSSSVPFDVKRIYYLYDIPGGETRGGHGHKELHQLIIAASGSFELILDDGKYKKVVTLNRPDYGLLITPGIWRDIINFSSGSILLVLASMEYKESDYLRDYDQFLNAFK